METLMMKNHRDGDIFISVRFVVGIRGLVMDNFSPARSSLHEFSDKSFDEILREEEERECNEKIQSGFHTIVHDKSITLLNE